MSTMLAPVALFVFNRPEHLRHTIESLQHCDGFSESPIIVFGDGPRDEHDIEKVEETRRVAREMLGTQAEYRFSESNKGLAHSIIDGIELLLKRHDRVIVVEDDLKLAPSFLRFLNEGLDYYAVDERVYQISGHMFDVPEFAQRQEALLLPLTTTWGWATWGRAWKAFDSVACGWEVLRKDRKLRKRFNLNGSYDYAHMLEKQMTEQRQSWGIRWYWSVFMRGGLSCFPPRSLVANIGMDGTGTHGRGSFRKLARDMRVIKPMPFVAPTKRFSECEEWDVVRAAVWRQNGGWIGRAVDWVRRRLWASVGS